MPPKRNIAYIKPEEPNFLKRLKAEIGYKEGDSIETKRQELIAGPEDLPDDDCSENPQVVVLSPGDLTETEVEAEKRRILKEEKEKPADLSQRVIFKPRTKIVPDAVEAVEQKTSKKAAKAPKAKPVLSFQDEDEEEE